MRLLYIKKSYKSSNILVFEYITNHGIFMHQKEYIEEIEVV